jgi:phosphatidylserine/phosphatidylglycerophosphate/cardiolipin synthase-like enzyme
MFRRVLLAFELGTDPAPAARLALGLAASPGALKVVARLSEGAARGLIEDPKDEIGASGLEAVLGPVTVSVALPSDSIAAHSAEVRADFLVLGPLPGLGRVAVALMALDAAEALSIPVLVCGDAVGSTTPPRRVLAVVDDRRQLASLGVFARDHTDRTDEFVVATLGDGAEVPVDLAGVAELVGIPCRVTSASVPGGRWHAGERIAAAAAEHEAGLIVVPHELARLSGFPPLRDRGLLVVSRLPVLVLPPVPAKREKESLDVPDAIAVGSELTLLVEAVDWLGRAHAHTGELVALGANGPVRLTCTGGEARFAPGVIPAGSQPLTIGRERPGVSDPLAAAETNLRLVNPGARRVALFDARLEAGSLATLKAALTQAPEPRVALAVRPASGERIEPIRARLTAAGFDEPLVVDARQVLDEGEPADVLPALHDVRLARVAARLRSSGVAVDAIVVTGELPPAGHGFAVVHENELATLPEAIGRAYSPPAPSPSVRLARFEHAACSLASAGHRVRVELDNLAARESLERLIATAKDRIHIQVYIASDDPVVVEIESALVHAARRGVAVRILADSLLSWHGSFGSTNPLLARLATEPGIEVRTIRPVPRLPSLGDLKRRDHRKLVVQDGRVAIVTGRNLARHYYLGFGEVRLRRASPWWEVPWLDAGVEFEGPQVARVEESFLSSWVAAGGAPFPIREVPRAGESALRVVIHESLADARTLEAYLALIDTAAERLLVVNCFPLHLELQRAFLRALGRGIALTFLTGNVRPLHGDASFSGGSIRELATDLIQSRLDPLIDAGARVHELALEGVRGWDPALGTVRPFVHAKIVVADGSSAALGSANLDITASYWESEALVVLEDSGLVSTLERDLDKLVVRSPRIERDDPRRAKRAARRSWLAHHWPTGILG